MRFSNIKFLTITYIASILWSCQEAKASFEPSFQVSKKTTHKIPDGQDYIFGYLEVLENRNNPQGNTIKLPVYIFKSRNPNSKKDPIIYTVGGPGSSTMRSAQYMNVYKYLDDRDLILFEQRGTQYAQPHLDCPEWATVIYTSNLPDFDTKQYDTLLNNAIKACKKRLEQNNIDLNQYNTNTIAADFIDLKETLNIQSYNLLTISYSTKIAQVLLRDYPEDIRSVVMDSPLPLEVNYDEESITNLMNVINKLFTDCQNNSNCNKAYPNLKNRFFKYLKEKTNSPLEVVVKNPNTENDETFYLKGEDLITVFRSNAIENVPFEINKILNNDLSSLKTQLSNLFNGPNSGSGIGMRLSVWCAEETVFNSQAKIQLETEKYKELKGLSPTVFSVDACKIWGVKRVNTIENKAIKSDIPVLLINGEYDNETPIKWATKMKANLPNSKHLVFKGWRHIPTTNWGNKCAMLAANDFFNNPNVKPNPDCFEKITNPDFKIK